MSQALSPGAAAGAGASGPAPLWRHAAFRGPLVAAGLLAIAAPLWWTPASAWLFDLEFAIAQRLPQETIAGAAWFALPLIGLACGLLASISPCVLPHVLPSDRAEEGARKRRAQ